MNHSTRKPTEAQAWRLEQLASMKCIACLIENCRQPSRTEVHHLVDFGYRRLSGGHDATLPLCAWHHRGQCAERFNGREMEARYGPSMALSKRAFNERYGTQRYLLETVNGILERIR